MHLYEKIREACRPASSPLFLYDYHSALVSCTPLFRVHDAAKIFSVMCHDADVQVRVQQHP
jgi:hypothetical protein